MSETDDPEERLRLFIRSHLEYHMSNLAEMKVLVREADSLTGRYAADITRLKREYSRICRRLLEGYAAHRNKTLDREQARILTSLLFGAMNWFYTWYDPARDYEQRGRIMDECFRMIAGTLSRARSSDDARRMHAISRRICRALRARRESGATKPSRKRSQRQRWSILIRLSSRFDSKPYLFATD